MNADFADLFFDLIGVYPRSSAAYFWYNKAMKFLHISDVHLGCTRYQLNESPRDFFEAWIDVLQKYAVQEKVDFVIMGGDFFHDPLPEADAYILMEVIHDWDDNASRRILGAVRRSARPNAKLLLIEALIPNDPSPNWPTTLDIVMLAIGGRQRTLREYSDLLRDSGFQMTREIDTHSGISIVEATAV